MMSASICLIKADTEAQIQVWLLHFCVCVGGWVWHVCVLVETGATCFSVLMEDSCYNHLTEELEITCKLLSTISFALLISFQFTACIENGTKNVKCISCITLH